MMYLLGSRGIPARHGGFETLAERLFVGLAEDGAEIVVIGTRDVAVKESPAGRLVARHLFSALETPLLTWTSRPTVGPGDAVLVVNPINAWTARHLSRTGARVILHMDGDEHARRKWGLIARLVHRLARRSAIRSQLELVADSRVLQKHLTEIHHRSSHYMPYGGCPRAEQSSAHRWLPAGARDYVLVVARPEPENQILEICRAFTISQATGRLLIVGAPPRPTRYWNRVELEASRNPQIELLGSIWDRSELCSLYLGSRGVIHGHTVGGTNPSLVDALSHGCVVLAHDNPYNREVNPYPGHFWKSETELAWQLGRYYAPPSPTHDVDSFVSSYNWNLVTKSYLSIMSSNLH
jgi:glycosyltransferase involved in cell wall biosynthesis